MSATMFKISNGMFQKPSVHVRQPNVRGVDAFGKKRKESDSMHNPMTNAMVAFNLIAVELLT